MGDAGRGCVRAAARWGCARPERCGVQRRRSRGAPRSAMFRLLPPRPVRPRSGRSGHMKNKRIRWVVAVVGAAILTVTIGLATVAFASPSSGTIAGSFIATGSMKTGMGLAVHPGTNTIVAQYTFGPHSSTGWHSHPGKTLVLVQSGTFTVYHDNCSSHTYGPGDAFVE